MRKVVSRLLSIILIASALPAVISVPAVNAVGEPGPSGSISFVRTLNGSGVPTNNQYLSIPGNARYTFEADFTVEAWVKFITLDSFQSFLGQYVSAPHWFLQMNGNQLRLYGTATGELASSVTFVTGRWYHIALVRSGTDLRIYVDGISTGSKTFAGTLGASASVNTVGAGTAGGNDRFNGSISNIRYVKGEALYTANFTPSTAPLTAVTNTVLLLNTTNDADYLKDNSAYGATITANGSPTADASSPFVDPIPGSFYLGNTYGDAGTRKTVSISQAGLGPGTGDFTYELWFKNMMSAASNSTKISTNIFGTRQTDGGVLDGADLQYDFASSWGQNPTVYLYNGTPYSTSTGRPTQEQWHHIAWVRRTNVGYLYLDGTLVSSGAETRNFTSTQLTLGEKWPSNKEGGFVGYMSNFRYVKGLAVYTGAFTVPTSPLRATQSSGTNIAAITSQTQILLNTPYASSTFLENTAPTGLFMTNAGATASTDNPFGNTPMYATPTKTADGYTVQISNYDNTFTYAGSVTSGSVAINGTGLVTVTGLAALTSATTTVTTSKATFSDKSSTVTSTSLGAALTPSYDSPTPTADGFTVQISNYDGTFTWATPTITSGSVARNGTGLLTATGVAPGTTATITQATSRTGYASSSSTVSGTAITGAALNPTFGTATSTADGFTVSITNYSASYTWPAPTITSGSVSASAPSGSNQLLTVTGLAPGVSATITQGTTRVGYTSGTATKSGTATSGTALNPTFGTPTATADGFTVTITNYNASYSWSGTATAGGVVSIDGTTGVVTVTGVAANASSTLTVNTTRTGYLNGTANVSKTSLGSALTPTFGTPTSTADGFTVSITNFDDSVFTWAIPTVSVGTLTEGTPSGGTKLLTITGLTPGGSATITQATSRTGYQSGNATITHTAIGSYIIVYTNGGGTGTLPTQADVARSGSFTLAAGTALTKSGYNFAGWSDGTTTYVSGATYSNVTSDLTLTAQWTAVASGGGRRYNFSEVNNGAISPLTVQFEKIGIYNKVTWNNSQAVTIIVTNYNGAKTVYENLSSAMEVPNPKPGESAEISVVSVADQALVYDRKTIYQAPLPVQALVIKQVASKTLSATWKPASSVVGYRVFITPVVGAQIVIETKDAQFKVETAPGQKYSFEVVSVGAGGLEASALKKSASVSLTKVVTSLIRVYQPISTRSFSNFSTQLLTTFASTLEPVSSILCTGTSANKKGTEFALAAASKVCAQLQKANPEVYVKSISKIAPVSSNSKLKSNYVVDISIVIKPIA